ncbi:hypothetical protein [Streptomyces sp. KL116D]|uniref:hypothetical protein n=1 Tax=Streptomyces sp. KL116D TaxID=3045152 RepID=UPI003555D26C
MKNRLARTVRAHAADRLIRGSAIVWERRTAGLAAWIRRSRRDDLTGWKAALGPVLCLVLVGILAWILYSVLRALPWLLGLLVALWCRAAWKAGRAPAEEAPAETPRRPRRRPMWRPFAPSC